MWSDVTSGLGSPVMTPWLTGHGPSPETSATCFEDQAQRLMGAIPDERPCYLSGYSMGARVALAMLIAAPDAFDGAVLISGHAGLDLDARASRRILDAQRARDLAERGLPAFVDMWESLPLFATQRRLDTSVFMRQREMRLAHDAEGVAHALRVLGAGAMPDYRATLAKIDTPMTFVAGALDDRYVQLATEMMSIAPNAACHVIAGAGHNPVLETPAEVAAILADQEAA